MLKVRLEIVSNGIIKTIIDDNFNGAGKSHEEKVVYVTEMDKNNSYLNTMKLFYEVASDLGIDMGNKFDKEVLEFKRSWGSHYEPDLEEVKQEIKDYRGELKYLVNLEKELKVTQTMQTIIDDSKK
tara:strand:- start:536 stop:913 length:378 start_codon:yes stop_codon:yes gene_type:complete